MSDEKNQAQTLYGRPDQMGKTPVGWRIELRYSDVAHRGHLFLRLVDPNDKAVAELHGLPKSKHQGTEDMQFDRMSKGMEDGSSLVVRHDDPSNLPVPGDTKGHRFPRFGEGRVIATVASGSAEEINGLWQRGKQAMDDINAKKPDYKAVDVAYELGHPTGGDIQNSNSTIFTIGRKMGLPLNSAIQDAGLERKFPGWGRDLLDLKRRPFVGEPPLAVRAAP